MINKRKSKGSMALKVTKKNKLGKKLVEKETFITKEKGSVFKKSTKKMKSSKHMLKASMSPAEAKSVKVLSLAKDHSTTIPKSKKKSGGKEDYHGLEVGITLSCHSYSHLMFSWHGINENC